MTSNDTDETAATAPVESESGIAATHVNAASGLAIPVAPAHSIQFNTIKMRLIPLACWRLEDINFEFGSSIPNQTIVKGLDHLAKLLAEVDQKDRPQLKEPNPITIFGHADPIGQDEDNKGLSGRRARAIYGLLTRDVEEWEQLYQQPHLYDNWKEKSLRTMLDFVSGVPGQDTTPYKNDSAKRKTLFGQYMGKLCPPGLSPIDKKKGFLGHNADKGGKADYQGCGEFNPNMLFSQNEENRFSKPENKTERDRENSVNRRVMVLIFRKGSTVDPAQWPCPRASDGTAGCRQRFWSDGEARRNKRLPDERRRHDQKGETFACRFYERIIDNSPCESPKPVNAWPVKVKGKLFWNRTWDYNDETKKFGPVKEYLPGAKVELRIQAKGEASLKVHGTVFLTDNGLDKDAGEFTFDNVPECTKAAIRIFLEYRDNKIVVVKGKSNAVTDPDFEIKTGQVIWHQLDLDSTKLTAAKPTIDFGDVEITRVHFIDICDAYKTAWFGHEKLKQLSDHDLPLLQVNYPEPPAGTSSALKQMKLLKDDLKDRDVILHEYGHFTHENVLGVHHKDYDYNDGTPMKHNQTSKEHYEDAWIEGLATAFSCILQNDAHYHDGYDTNLNQHLDSDNTTVGPHCEGSIQEALWDLVVVQKTDFKSGFWKAFSDTSKRNCATIFDLFDNWKDLGLADLDKVIASYKKFNMEFGYRYRSGAESFTCVAAPTLFDSAKKEFRTIDELFDNFGKLGAGTLADYKEEFYNRNKKFNAGALDAGSTIAAPKVKVGNKYIVPERFQVKK